MNLMVRTSILSVMVWELVNQNHGVRKMKVPNWQHHSKKDAKRKLKPQALRQAKARRGQLIKRLLNPTKRGVSSYNRFISKGTNDSSARNQIPTC